MKKNYTALICLFGFLSSTASLASEKSEPSKKDSVSAEIKNLTLGPSRDFFNDQKSNGYVYEGIRFVPAAAIAFFNQSDPLQDNSNISIKANTSYISLNAKSADPQGAQLLAALEKTQYEGLNNEGSNTRYIIRYSTISQFNNWLMPIAISNASDSLSRSSFYVQRDLNTSNTQANALIDQTLNRTILKLSPTRAYDNSSVDLDFKITDMKIGAVATSNGVSMPSKFNNINYLAAGNFTYNLNETTSVFTGGQYQHYIYDTAGLTDAINPISRNTSISTGVNKKLSDTIEITSDIGISQKTSSRIDLVPNATHTVGSLNSNWMPTKSTRAQFSLSKSTQDVNITGISNLALQTLDLDLKSRLNESIVISMNASDTYISANEVTGNAKDTQLNVGLHWKPVRKAVISLSFNKTQRKTTQGVSSLVPEFTDNKSLIDFKYFL
jgi:hypothetical protein